MSLTQGNEILVESPDGDEAQKDAANQSSSDRLVSWVVTKVNKWEDQRNQAWLKLWSEYWRIWRGKWAEDDKNRNSERSRLIAPALAQAIEMTVSEIEEAVFSKEVWFDIADNMEDKEKGDAYLARDMLLEDLDNVNAKDAISEAVLNAAIFGTGIVKVSTYVDKEQSLERDAETKQLKAVGDERVYVCVDSIRPDEFVPDPSGRTIQEMLGCAHKTVKPVHSIIEKISSGTYRKDALSGIVPTDIAVGQRADDTDTTVPSDQEHCSVTEYHGKVPLELLNAAMEDDAKQKSIIDDVLAATGDTDAIDESELVEAIVTIANDGVLLRAMVNPFVMRDRSIIAFQFEKVPGRFWGRGVSEKGYNPQKALDAEIRARIDALGYVSAPMLGVDSGRIPRGFKMEIKPGKVWLTQGKPEEVLSPVKIGEINANTFNQASEMERMVQMGTGAFDTATALKSQSASGSNSLSANSMLMGAFVKRAKRSIQNVDRNFLQPLIQKVMWRYMQFAPRKYPKDYNFQVKATMGIIAREVEAMQTTQLIGMMPEQFSKVSLQLAVGIIENSSMPNKAQVMKAVEEAMAPPSEEQQQKQKELADLQFEAAKAQAQGALLQNQETMAKIRKLLAEAQSKIREGDLEDDRLKQEHMRIELMAQEIATLEQQNSIAIQRLRIENRKVDVQQQKVAVDARKTQPSGW